MPKFTFFILSILCLNVSVSAQTNLKMTSSNDLNNDYLDQNHQLKSNLEILTILNDPNQKKCNTYKKMAKSGKIMTFVGGGFGVLSTATTVLGIAILEEDDLGAIAIVGGAVGMLLGYGTMTGGIILKSIGKKKQLKYCDAGTLKLDKSKFGYGLVYSF